MSGAGNPMGTGGANFMNVSDVKTNSDNTSMAQYSLGGLTTSNSDAETRALVESRF